MGGYCIIVMKKVLLTGGSGFIGRNIKEHLSEICELYVPERSELNLLDEKAVREYIKRNKIQIVIHGANPNPVKNPIDNVSTMFEDSMRVFMNLYNAREHYEYMYTLGSGAEYDKSSDIVLAEESDKRTIPYDGYGLAKYIMNELVKKCDRMCNLRLFACYGPTDHYSKFITHAIRCCIYGEDITIRQNCYYDYMHVSDLANILEYFIYHIPKYHEYNVCSGERHSLKEIAEIVRRQMKANNVIVLLKNGLNNEYTGSNKRLLDEIGLYQFVTLEEGIERQIIAEKEYCKNSNAYYERYSK